jgi:hypothetical protein
MVSDNSNTVTTAIQPASDYAASLA